MKCKILLLFLLYCGQTWARQSLIEGKYNIKNFIVSKKTKDKVTVIKYDLNSDKLVDRIEKWSANQQIFKSVDQNFDGIFEKTENFYPRQHHFKTVHKTLKDGTQRIKKFTIIDINTIQVKVFLLLKGVEVLHDQYHLSRNQKECEDYVITGLENLEILNTYIEDLSLNMSPDMIDVGFGYQATKSCFNKWGTDSFKDDLLGGIQQGMICLMDLQTKHSSEDEFKVSSALENLMDYQSLIENSKVTITCEETTGYDWEGTRAHASTSANDHTRDNKVKHPFISINPSYPKTGPPVDQEERLNIRRTIFHEQLHNLGILHSENIDFPYTCGDCCFPDKTADNAKKIKDLSCRICTGDYLRDEYDVNYISDIIQYSKLTYNEEILIGNALRYAHVSPNDVEAISMISNGLESIFSPVGKLLAKKIENTPNLTSTEISATHLDQVNEGTLLDSAEAVIETSQPIADAYFELFYNHNSKRALEFLNNNKESLKTLLNTPTNEENKFVIPTIKKQIKDLINTIWLDKFDKRTLPNGTTTDDVAYDLNNYLFTNN